MDPENGHVTIQGFEAIYACSEGYQLEGDGTRVCQSDSTWSKEEPQCVLQNQTIIETAATPPAQQTEPETAPSSKLSTQPDLETVVGSLVAVSVFLIVVIVTSIVIICCVCRYLKRELEVPTKGPETIEFGKIKK